MWTISEVKERGKAAFKANYWKTVLVALIFTVCIGGVGASSGASVKNNYDETIEENGGTQSFDFNDYLQQELAKQGIEASDEDIAMALVAICLIIFGVIAIVLVVSSLIRLLLLNPLSVGCHSYFIRNLGGDGSLDHLGDGFKPWGRNIGAMFLTDLFLFLWFCLLFIPGIIKSYSYRMVPYILADHPEYGAMEAIKESCRIMKGNKFKAFLLDLSFIGWFILTAITLGILGLFYVNPYYYSTDAALYEAIK